MGIQTRGVAGVKTTTDIIRRTSYTPEEAKRELARLTRMFKGDMKDGSFAAFKAHITRRTVANGHKPKAKAAPGGLPFVRLSLSKSAKAAPATKAAPAPAAKPWKVSRSTFGLRADGLRSFAPSGLGTGLPTATATWLRFTSSGTEPLRNTR